MYSVHVAINTVSFTNIISNQVKEKMGRLVEYILLLVSVLLVVSTLTGSTNNYYNGKILTTILMDNIPVSIIYTINNKNLLIIKDS